VCMMGKYQLGGAIEAEQRCVTFGVGGRIGSDPSLGVGFLAHACSGGPNCAQSHPPKRVKSQSALGFLLSQGCAL
jgi:hypothetical protein